MRSRLRDVRYSYSNTTNQSASHNDALEFTCMEDARSMMTRRFLLATSAVALTGGWLIRVCLGSSGAFHGDPHR